MKPMRALLLHVLSLLVLAGALAAQSAAAMTNADVIKLASAHLGDDVILSKIKASTCAFDTGTDSLIALKQAGVSDGVIGAMTACGNAMAATANANDPMAPHESGIYLANTGADGKTVLSELELANYQGSKTSGRFMSRLTHGIAKQRIVAVIPGPSASIRTAAPDPVFYFYFDDTATGLSGRGAHSQVSDPNQFTLIKLKANGHDRQTAVASSNNFGQNMGADEKSVMAFRSERMRPGVYKVTVTPALEPGEYCFVASGGFSRGSVGGVTAGVVGGAGAGAAIEIYDFGVGGQ